MKVTRLLVTIGDDMQIVKHKFQPVVTFAKAAYKNEALNLAIYDVGDYSTQLI